MRKLILVAALMLPAIASAEVVYVQTGKGHQCVGDKFPITAPMEVLYKDRACKLPIVHAKDMRAYHLEIKGSDLPGKKNPAVSMAGCWGSTLDGSYIVIREDGSTDKMPPNAYVSASLGRDEVATVFKSPNQGTAFAKAMEMCP